LTKLEDTGPTDPGIRTLTSWPALQGPCSWIGRRMPSDNGDMKACSRGGGIRHRPSPDNPHAVRASYPAIDREQDQRVITDTITRFLLFFLLPCGSPLEWPTIFAIARPESRYFWSRGLGSSPRATRPGRISVARQLLLELDPPVLLLVVVAALIHTLTAWWDDAYAERRRRITPFEQVLHGFLIVIPVIGTALIFAQQWGSLERNLECGAERLVAALETEPHSIALSRGRAAARRGVRGNTRGGRVRAVLARATAERETSHLTAVR
jgi:hypothetical protein